MNKRACLLMGSALLFGCTGHVESVSTGGGGASSTTTSTSTTSSTSTSTSQGGGGSGGGLFGGSGGDTTTSTSATACAQVLDKGWYVSFSLDGQPLTMFTDGCIGSSDGLGPMARVYHGKGGPGWMAIDACPSSDLNYPLVALHTDHPETPGSVTQLTYVDDSGNHWTTDTGVSTFNVYGPEWTTIEGNFDGKLASPDGSIKTLSGSFLVCRRPDLFAP